MVHTSWWRPQPRRRQESKAVWATFLIVPLLLWAATPRQYWWLLAIFGGVLTLVIAAWYIYQEWNKHLAAEAITAPKAAYRWHKSWDTAQFQRHFSIFLRERGWRIVSATQLGADRLQVVVDKQKVRIALLCVQPGHAATVADNTQLQAARADVRVTELVLVTDSTATAEERNEAVSRNMWLFNFDDLDNLDEALVMEQS